MVEQLKANIGTNWRFYRRSKLLLVVALILFLIWGLGFFPTLFFISAGKKFVVIQLVLQQTLGMISIFIAFIGIFNIYYQLHNRCYKMVVTKPCRPAIWLMANVISGMMLAGVLHLIVLLITCILFALWGIPFQWGLLYVVFSSFFKTAVAFSLLCLLTIAMHPIVAVAIYLIFNEGTFYFLGMMCSAGLKSAGNLMAKIFMHFFRFLFYGIYYIVPGTDIFENISSQIEMSLKMAQKDWLYLMLNFLYTVAIGIFCLFLSDRLLRKKRTI